MVTIVLSGLVAFVVSHFIHVYFYKRPPIPPIKMTRTPLQRPKIVKMTDEREFEIEQKQIIERGWE